ncbi:MAG: LexA family transcriptional regulator [Gemmiger sp.]
MSDSQRIAAFPQRLSQAMSNCSMRQNELCLRTGIPKSAMSQYMHGRFEPRHDRLAAMAAALNVTEAWLAGYDVPMERSPSPALPDGALPLPAGQRIPILGRVAAGLPMYAEENIEGYVFGDGESGEQYFALRVQGDSMTAAGINDGDLVVVRQQSIVDDNDIAVVCVNGCEATVKRFHRNGQTVILTPQSYNPVHQAQFYDLKETPVHIYGKVIEVRHRI